MNHRKYKFVGYVDNRGDVKCQGVNSKGFQVLRYIRGRDIKDDLSIYVIGDPVIVIITFWSSYSNIGEKHFDGGYERIDGIREAYLVKRIV